MLLYGRYVGGTFYPPVVLGTIAIEYGLPPPDPPPTPPPPVPADLVFVPESDTIRGGKEIVFSLGGSLLDTSRDESFLSTSLPAGWSNVTSGSGQRLPTAAGLVLDTRLAAASQAGIETPDNDYVSFDVAVDVELFYPVGATSVPVNLAVLETETSSGSTARVRLCRGWGADPTLTVGFGDLLLVGEPDLTGGIVDAGSALEKITLRIVRDAARVFGFVGKRDSTGRYTMLQKVIDYDAFPIDAGAVRFYVGNNTLARRVQTRFSNFTVRSHALINSRLVEDKVDVSTRRMTGVVPAATLEEVGLHDLTVFGLFGSVTSVNGFEYTLPAEKTVGRVTARRLFTVQDPVLRDG